MNENDFFQLRGDDHEYIKQTERRNIEYKGGLRENLNPFVFLDLDRDEYTGRIRQIGAFIPEHCYTLRPFSKSDAYVRSSEQGWSSLYIPIHCREPRRNQKYHWFKTMGYDSVEFFQDGEAFLRCLDEGEALLRFLQYLTPFKFCYGGVTLVTYSEQDIKFILRKISDCCLTQLFMSNVANFLTLLHVLSTPEVPASFENLIETRHVTLCCLLGNSAQKARALANAFVGSRETFISEIERKDFSVLEEFYHMNYTIRLDEGHEENTVLYFGDLNAQIQESDIRELVGNLVGISNLDYSVKMCTHPKTRAFLGYAYVQFNNHDQALKTLSRLNNEHLHGTAIRVVWLSKKANTNDKWRSNLFVKNIPLTVTQKDLNDAFSAFGKVLSSKVSLDSRGGSKGFGFVQFDKLEDSERAISKMHNLPVAPDKNLFVSIKLSDEERKREQRSRVVHNQGFAVQVQIQGYLSLDAEGMFEKFNQVGVVNSIIKNELRNSTALVVFDMESCAESSIDLNATQYLGSRLEVSLAHKRASVHSEPKKYTSGTTLFVGNLDLLMRDGDLKQLFVRTLPQPPVLSAVVKTDLTGRSLMYGYVTVHTKFAPTYVSLLNGKLVGGKKLSVLISDGDDEDSQAEGKKDEGASTSKGRTMPPLALAASKDPPKIDQKSLLSNRIRNAVRKKLKDAATGQDQLTPAKEEVSTIHPMTSSAAGQSASSSRYPPHNPSSSGSGLGVLGQPQHPYGNPLFYSSQDYSNQQQRWEGDGGNQNTWEGYPPGGNPQSWEGYPSGGGYKQQSTTEEKGYNDFTGYNPMYGQTNYGSRDEQQSSGSRNWSADPEDFSSRYSRSPSQQPNSWEFSGQQLQQQQGSYAYQEGRMSHRDQQEDRDYVATRSWSTSRRRSRSRHRSRSRSWERNRRSRSGSRDRRSSTLRSRSRSGSRERRFITRRSRSRSGSRDRRTSTRRSRSRSGSRDRRSSPRRSRSRSRERNWRRSRNIDPWQS